MTRAERASSCTCRRRRGGDPKTKCADIACFVQDERHEILVSLSRNMSLDADVDLKHFAQVCEHFTGADFKGNGDAGIPFGFGSKSGTYKIGWNFCPFF